jgi:hypothetical protein
MSLILCAVVMMGEVYVYVGCTRYSGVSPYIDQNLVER